MKYDDLDVVECTGTEAKPIEKVLRKKKKFNVYDLVIVQLMLCVVISAIVLTARVITVASLPKNDSPELPTITAVFEGISDTFKVK